MNKSANTLSFTQAQSNKRSNKITSGKKEGIFGKPIFPQVIKTPTFSRILILRIDSRRFNGNKIICLISDFLKNLMVSRYSMVIDLLAEYLDFWGPQNGAFLDPQKRSLWRNTDPDYLTLKS